MNTKFRRLLASVWVAVLATAFAGGVAGADPDPHVPDPQTDYCPGGGGGSLIYLGYCDGVPYSDGSYWHYVQYGVPVVGHPSGLFGPGMQCVVGGGPIPQPAPSGGCDGAV